MTSLKAFSVSRDPLCRKCVEAQFKYNAEQLLELEERTMGYEIHSHTNSCVNKKRPKSSCNKRGHTVNNSTASYTLDKLKTLRSSVIQIRRFFIITGGFSIEGRVLSGPHNLEIAFRSVVVRMRTSISACQCFCLKICHVCMET